MGTLGLSLAHLPIYIEVERLGELDGVLHHQFLGAGVALGGAGVGVEVDAQSLPLGLAQGVGVIQLDQGHIPEIVAPFRLP